MTYRDAGVDIEKAERLIDSIKARISSTFNPYVLNPIGGFASLLAIPKEYRDPIIVASTDGVGTKLKIAQKLKNHRTVGIDLVAMCANDILTYGARPLFFLDYFACGRLDDKIYEDVISGICEGCSMAGCALVGGETAEMPSFYKKGEYDLAGFILGIVDKEKVVDGKGITEGDLVIGIGSSGLHSNGFSLVRKLFFELKRVRLDRKMPGLSGTLGEELLRPTKIYVKPVLEILKIFKIKGMAHITGGGIYGNLKRIIPPSYMADLEIKKERIPHIFLLIKEMGELSYDEMFSTFNMGIGFVLIVEKEEGTKVIESLKEKQEEAFLIGEIKKKVQEEKVRITLL
ncbi:MAG: phosphoribosylformylglycinamidine cyclo-ligase [Desulfobacterota bacterium]|nr:phosphoribosylformylglycinamidine cyclo-ligase [Thermodesulfobacteriota bacterium]MDW8001094.1 phosphoribosylformylglycinamidine cyclo-ligase [Deltaproteobacteria bacterium]